MSRPLITVKRLRAMARDRASVELPDDALITPAAEDWLRSVDVSVTRGASPEPRPETKPTIYVVGDGNKSVLQTLVPIMEREHDDVRFTSCNGRIECLLDGLKTACEGLAGCSRRRGLVLVEDGTIPVCVANKYPQVRAAMISRPSSLYRVVRRLGANLLVLETESMSLRQLKAIIDEFLTGKSTIEPVIEAALSRAGG